jgi:heme-degrading monooxygenase HmoA
MVELAATMPGFIGVESARNAIGITVSYWRDLESIANWKRHAEHLAAQGAGRRTWYDSYQLRIARVERGVWLYPPRIHLSDLPQPRRS